MPHFVILNSFHASGNFCYLLITFANSLDPDQGRHSVGPDLDPYLLTLLYHSCKILLKRLILKSMKNKPARKEIMKQNNNKVTK